MRLWAKLVYDRKFRAIGRIEARLESGIADANDNTVEQIINDIRSSWSGFSPSAIGSAPAVVTGNLDSSVVAGEDQPGRDILGRFAGKNVIAKSIRVSTAEGDDPQDRGEYAMALEDPDYLNRPFFAPALERAFGTYTSNIKRFVRL